MAKSKNKDFLKEELIKEDLRMKNIFSENININLNKFLKNKNNDLNDIKMEKEEFIKEMKKKKKQFKLTNELLKIESLKLNEEYRKVFSICNQWKNDWNELEINNDEEIKEIINNNNSEEKKIKESIENSESRYEAIINIYNEMINLKSELKTVKENLKIEKIQKLTDIANKEKEKVIETIKLKKQIERKEKEAEKSLNKLKKDEINITTKLTFLQNYELNGELNFQSKEIEILLQKNKNYQEIVNNLKKEVEIHKQVENELSNKSQKSQDIIKEMSNELKNNEETCINLDNKINNLQQKIEKLNFKELEENYIKYHKELNLKNKELENIKIKNNFFEKKINIQNKKWENIFDNDSLIINNIIMIINKIEKYFNTTNDGKDINNNSKINKKIVKYESILKKLFKNNFSDVDNFSIKECEKIFQLLIMEFKKNLKINKNEINEIKNNTDYDVSFSKISKKNEKIKLPKIKSKIEPKNLINHKNSDFHKWPINHKAYIIKMSASEIKKLGINVKKIR